MSSSSLPAVGEVRPHVFAQLTRPVPAPGAEPAPETDAEPELASAEPTVELPEPEEIAAAARAEGFEQGYQEGFQRGYDDGLGLARQEQQAAIATLAQLAENALLEADQLVRTVEEQVVTLSLAIAEKVIEREVRLDRTIVLGVVRAALDEVQDAATLRVHVNPQDYDLVLARWDGALPRSLAQRSELIADEHVEAGGCLIETRVGHADAQLGTKLAQVTKSFQAALEGEPV